MNDFYGKMAQEVINQYYQRYASIESEDKEAMNEKTDRREDSGVIIDETTIYEIDLDCYDCLKKRKRNNKNNP